MKIKFNQYYVTNGTAKSRVHYSIDGRIDGRKCVTIYARDYDRKSFRDIFGDIAKNDSDSMTDYFETSRATFFEDHPMYKLVLEKAEYFNEKIRARRIS